MGKDTRTYKDRAEYNKQAVSKRRKKIKELAVEYKGGKCQICGYKKHSGALEFHHLNEKEKKFGLSTGGLTRSWERVKCEVEKCLLLCANCHREVHGGMYDKNKLVELYTTC